MTLPEIPQTTQSPGSWACSVSRFEPHGLDLLEAHVLAYRTEASVMAHTPAGLFVWQMAAAYLAPFAAGIGFAAVFGVPIEVVRSTTYETSGESITWAMIAFIVATAGLTMMFVRWLTEGRRRVAGARGALVVTFAFAVAAIPVAFGLAAGEGVAAGARMVPTYATAALAVVLFVLMQVSPKPDPVPEAALEDLNDKAMAYLMKARSEAIDELAKRRMLGDADPDALKARPLGRLHIEDDGPARPTK